MQNEAEKYLISVLKKILKLTRGKKRMINLGAAQSIVVEKALRAPGCDFICDRTDIQDCRVRNNSYDFVGESYICKLEKLSPIPSGSYDAAFANFVLEHVNNPVLAASEMARILKPGGQIVISLSNPQAPEFRIARITPTSFHQFFREDGHDDAYPVKYAYKSIPKLIKIMENQGLHLIDEQRFPAVFSYLFNFHSLARIASAYDHFLIKKKLNSWMGHAVLVFKK